MRCFKFSVYTILSLLLTFEATSQEIVNFFQPVDGSGSTGFLGLHNKEMESSTVTLSATDDRGAGAPGGDISIVLEAEQSVYLSSVLAP